MAAIVCAVRLNYYPCDDYVTFKVHRGVSGTCNSSTCSDYSKYENKWGNNYSRETVINDASNYAKNFHFCYRQTRNGKTCDINYAVEGYEYKDNGLCFLYTIIEYIGKAGMGKAG